MTSPSETKEQLEIYSESWEPRRKVLFVFNPVAGKSQIKTDLLDILVTLAGDSRLITSYPTKCRGDARKTLRNLKEDFHCVICAGGDGTLDEVVTGMMENPLNPSIPIGYIPAGTTNDFASSLGIPTNLKDAAKAAVGGKTFLCDLGRFNDDAYFTYVAAFGIFTGTSYETPQDMKNMLGHLAYILQGMMDLSKIRTYRFHVESDELSITDDFAFGMITNSKSVGGFSDITGSRVDLSDGLFEVTLVKMPTNIFEINDIVQYFNHTSDTSELIFQCKTSHIVLESDEPVKWTRDGEYGGACKRVELTNLHEKLRIIVPDN